MANSVRRDCRMGLQHGILWERWRAFQLRGVDDSKTAQNMVRKEAGAHAFFGSRRPRFS